MDTYIDELVSIIMPSYNSSRFIGGSIESILNQSYSKWELLVVDDCSVDNSRDIIRSYADLDNRIQAIFLEKNVGAASARNIAIDKAQGRYIAFLDSDDVWYQEKLMEQLLFMTENKVAFCFSSYDTMTEGGACLNKPVNVPKTISYKGYLFNTIIGCLTVVLDRSIVGHFNMPIIKSSHDMALWCLIMRRGFKAYGIQKSLACYRLVSNSNTAKKKKAALDVWRVYRNIEQISLLPACLYFTGYALNAVKKRL